MCVCVNMFGCARRCPELSMYIVRVNYLNVDIQLHLFDNEWLFQAVW